MAKSLMTNSAVNAAAGMMMLFTGIVSSIIAARLLGPEANGIIAFSYWLSLSGAMIAGFGTDVILSRTLPQLKVSGYSPQQRLGFASYLGWVVVAGTLIVLAAYAFIFYELEKHHWASSQPTVLEITGLLFVVQSIGYLSINFLIGEQRPQGFLRLTLMSSALQLMTVFFGAYYYGVAGALIGYVIGQSVFLLYSIRILMTPRDACGFAPKQLAKTSFVLSVQVIIESVFLNRLELLFIQQFHGVRDVGFYAIGLSLANLALQLPVQLTGSLLPYYTEQIKSSQNGKLPIHLFENVVRSLAYIALPMGFGVAAVAWGLVTIIFGDEFQDASNTVTLLAIGAPISVFMQISTKYLLAMDKEKQRLRIGGIGAFVMVAGCLLLVPYWGGIGAAIARLFVFLVMSVLLVRQMDFDGSLRPMFVSLAKIGAAAAGCGLAAFWVEQRISGFAGLALAILTGVIVYVFLIKIFRAFPREDYNSIHQIMARLPRPVRLPTTFVMSMIVT